MKKPPLVFVDTNVFRDANLIRTRAKIVPQEWEWGPLKGTHELTVYEKYSSLERYWDKPEQTDLVQNVMCLPALSYLASKGHIELVTSLEVENEALFQPNAKWAGRLFDANVGIVHKSGPYEYGRITMGAFASAKQLTADFLSGIKDDEYWDNCLAFGGAKIRHQILDLGQALDAHHVWTAKHLNCDFFLTRDRKLQKAAKAKTLELGPLKIITARDLYIQILALKPLVSPYYFVTSLFYARKIMNGASTKP